MILFLLLVEMIGNSLCTMFLKTWILHARTCLLTRNCMVVSLTNMWHWRLSLVSVFMKDLSVNIMLLILLPMLLGMDSMNLLTSSSKKLLLLQNSSWILRNSLLSQEVRFLYQTVKRYLQFMIRFGEVKISAKHLRLFGQLSTRREN